MSFDIFLKRFETGKPAPVNREAVLTVLKASKHIGPDEFGFYQITFPDGTEIDLSAKGLQQTTDFTGCNFEVRGLGPHVVEFIFAIAKTGDMVILPAMKDFVPILSRSGQHDELPPDLAANDPAPVLCSSSQELESLLSGGFTGWQKYRDQGLRAGGG